MSLEGPESGSLRIAADVGGTFTDIAVFDEWPRPPRPPGSPAGFAPSERGFFLAASVGGLFHSKISARCLIMANSGHSSCARVCPLLG
jgi:hypothetical protein